MMIFMFRFFFFRLNLFEFNETSSCTQEFCLIIFLYLFCSPFILSSTDKRQAFYKNVEFVDSSYLKIQLIGIFSTIQSP